MIVNSLSQSATCFGSSIRPSSAKKLTAVYSSFNAKGFLQNLNKLNYKGSNHAWAEVWAACFLLYLHTTTISYKNQPSKMLLFLQSSLLRGISVFTRSIFWVPLSSVIFRSHRTLINLFWYPSYSLNFKRWFVLFAFNYFCGFIS